MERLPQLTAKIDSLGDLRELFRAMRAVAAAHVQEAQAALDGIRRYAQVIEDAIAEGAMLLGDEAPPDAPDRRGGVDSVLLVACSEHGFTGGFNERLLAAAIDTRRADETLAIIGSRGVVRATEHELDVGLSFPMATHLGGVLGVTRRVAGRIAGAARARIVFGRYRRGAEYEVEVRSILPLDTSLFAGPVRDRQPLHHLDAAMLLQRLAGEYLFAEITRAVTESFACENGARLKLMESADRNIDDRLDKLRHRQMTVRQRQITAELLDVVTGAEAVLADGSQETF